MNDKVENNEASEQADEIAAQNERVVMHVPEIIKSVTDDRRLFQHVKIADIDVIITTTWKDDAGCVTSNIGFGAGGLDLLRKLLDA